MAMFPLKTMQRQGGDRHFPMDLILEHRGIRPIDRQDHDRGNHEERPVETADLAIDICHDAPHLRIDHTVFCCSSPFRLAVIQP